MDKAELGQTGLKLSKIGLGTVKFGRNQGVKYPESFTLPTDEELSDLIECAKKSGINTLDTAPAYGSSELRLGNLLKGQREQWIILAKAGEEFENGQSSFNYTIDHIERSLERTLKRLQTDYIDILLIHSNGNDLDILKDDALIKKMHAFKKTGIVKAIGASTKTAEGGIKALELMDVVMATYTQQYQDEKPVLDYAARHNKGVVLKKVLSSGHNTNIQDALQFSLSHQGVTSAIIGTINPKHLEKNCNALNKLKLKLTPLPKR